LVIHEQNIPKRKLSEHWKGWPGMEKVQYTKELLSDLIARFYRHREEGVLY